MKIILNREKKALFMIMMTMMKKKRKKEKRVEFVHFHKKKVKSTLKSMPNILMLSVVFFPMFHILLQLDNKTFSLSHLTSKSIYFFSLQSAGGERKLYIKITIFVSFEEKRKI
jgi:hypothetical protein